MRNWLASFFRLCRQEKKWLLGSLILLLLLAATAVFLLSANSGISWALYPTK